MKKEIKIIEELIEQQKYAIINREASLAVLKRLPEDYKLEQKWDNQNLTIKDITPKERIPEVEKNLYLDKIRLEELKKLKETWKNNTKK